VHIIAAIWSCEWQLHGVWRVARAASTRTGGREYRIWRLRHRRLPVRADLRASSRQTLVHPFLLVVPEHLVAIYVM